MAAPRPRRRGSTTPRIERWLAESRCVICINISACVPCSKFWQTAGPEACWRSAPAAEANPLPGDDPKNFCIQRRKTCSWPSSTAYLPLRHFLGNGLVVWFLRIKCVSVKSKPPRIMGCGHSVQAQFDNEVYYKAFDQGTLNKVAALFSN